MKTKLILIDGNAIMHRAYHALPHSLTTTKGEPINAVYGFVSMLIRIIQDLKPTHIAVAFDTPVETLRKAQYVGYQANRPRMESEMSSQFEIIYKVLAAMKIPVYMKERYEADDVIGTIAHECIGEIDEVVVVTGDRDILQLVDDREKIFVYMPIKGLTNAKLYKESDVVERLGVKPKQIIDYKGLVGDPSDNYPGVNGIGPKTATDLIEKYGTVEDIYKHIGEIPEKTSKKLALGAESAVMSKSLATIMENVPVNFKLGDAGEWNISSDETLKYFREIGFKTLTNRVQQLSMI